MRDRRLADELGERCVSSESDQQTARALQPAQVPSVGSGDSRNSAQVTLHSATLVANLLGNFEQFVEILEEYEVVRRGEDVASLG